MNTSKFLVIANKLKPCLRFYQQKTMQPSSLCPPPPPKKFNVTLMDATSKMGEALAVMLKENALIRELRLYDDKDTIGIGMDISDIDTSARIAAFSGEPLLKEALTGADLVVTCGGRYANPFESYEDVFIRNAEDVRRTAMYLTEFNPKAVFCIAKPPVESLVPMVYEEYLKAEIEIPDAKIIGAANYTTMRACHWIGKFIKQDEFKINCPIVGGASPETAVAVVSGSNYGKTISNPRVLCAIQDGMAYAEEKVLTLKLNEEGGCVALAPAVATYRLVNNILKGLRGDPSCYDCAFLRQEGHLKKFLPYMTSIVQFGPYGVHTTHMPDMVGGELYRLKNAYPILKAYIHLGENYVHGCSLMECNLICYKPCNLEKFKTVEDTFVKIKNPDEYEKSSRIEERRDRGKPCKTC